MRLSEAEYCVHDFALHSASVERTDVVSCYYGLEFWFLFPSLNLDLE